MRRGSQHLREHEVVHPIRDHQSAVQHLQKASKHPIHFLSQSHAILSSVPGRTELRCLDEENGKGLCV